MRRPLTHRHHPSRGWRLLWWWWCVPSAGVAWDERLPPQPTEEQQRPGAAEPQRALRKPRHPRPLQSPAPRLPAGLQMRGTAPSGARARRLVSLTHGSARRHTGVCYLLTCRLGDVFAARVPLPAATLSCWPCRGHLYRSASVAELVSDPSRDTAELSPPVTIPATTQASTATAHASAADDARSEWSFSHASGLAQ